MKSEDDLIAEMAEEIAAHEAPLTLVLRPVVALQLAALLQLATRHPGISAAHHDVARLVIEHVRGYFAGAPAVLEALRRGDSAAH